VRTRRDLDPEERSIVRQLVATGQPVTRVRLAPATIEEADQVRRADPPDRGHLLATLIFAMGVIVGGIAEGHVGAVALGLGILAITTARVWWRRGHPSPAARRAAATKASAERLLEGRG
jgi:hypothetical protein